MKILKQFLKGFQKGMHNFGSSISIIINSILLTIVYFIGVGITSVVAKLVGKHFLDVRRDKKDTYWSNLNLKKKSIDDYYKQF